MNQNNELPLDTLDMSELLVQWKVMKALGYHSLFDADFRRELRNPYRKALYYRLTLVEELTDKKFLMNNLTNVSDRLSFFQNPSLYKQIKEEEERLAMENPTEHKKRYGVAKTRFDKDMQKHVAPSDKDQQEAMDFLKGKQPDKSLTKGVAE